MNIKVAGTQTGEPTPSFQALVVEGKLMINLSYGMDTQKDEDGNDITVFLWTNGDWKVSYKGKEYLIPLGENVMALIEWINKKEETHE